MTDNVIDLLPFIQTNEEIVRQLAEILVAVPLDIDAARPYQHGRILEDAVLGGCPTMVYLKTTFQAIMSNKGDARDVVVSGRYLTWDSVNYGLVTMPFMHVKYVEGETGRERHLNVHQNSDGSVCTADLNDPNWHKYNSRPPIPYGEVGYPGQAVVHGEIRRTMVERNTRGVSKLPCSQPV